MINWKVRIRNKNFWIALIPAVLLFVQMIMNLLGVGINVDGLNEKLLAIVNAIFAILAILGIVNDPTTEGIGDSSLAMTYEIPKMKNGVSKKEGEKDAE